MTRKPASNSQPARGSKDRGSFVETVRSKRHPTLGALRGEIDRLDQNLVGLLNRRAEIAALIGQIKHDQGIEVWSAAREDEVVSKALAASAGPAAAGNAANHLPRADERLALAAAHHPRRLPGPQIQLQSSGRRGQVW